MTTDIISLVHNPGLRKMKIVVAMSGGVDSSAVAAVLSHLGHEVIGVTLQLYDHGMALARKGACCAGQDIYDAQIAAEKIGIPHYVLNYESVFKETVIDDFADSYLRGETPIPCVRCNQNVKFRDLVKVAQDLQADCLATGHYVRRFSNSVKSELHKAIDPSKDQSYFLFATTQEQLDYLRFPLGGLRKEQTRELASYFDLAVSNKPDSQDICFVPNGDYASVIKKVRPQALRKGEIIHLDGQVLGEHEGIINFTIGQRRGLFISHSTPLYVVKLDPTLNQVVVGPRDALLSKQLIATEVNWIGEDIPDDGFECDVKLRSMHTPLPAIIHKLPNNSLKVELLNPYAGITPGQACVVYQDDRVLGGGWIARDAN